MSIFFQTKHPDGVDILIEMLANVNLERDTSLMAYRGRIVVSEYPKFMSGDLTVHSFCLFIMSQLYEAFPSFATGGRFSGKSRIHSARRHGQRTGHKRRHSVGI